MTRPERWTILAALAFPAACTVSYWEDHISPDQKVLILPAAIFLTLSTVLTMYVVKLREAFLREVFRTHPELREQGWLAFDPKSVSRLSTWMGLCGISCSVFVAHGGLRDAVVHDAFVVIGAVGITFYLTAQVGLSYTVMQVTSHRVCRLRNFLRWCCLFVLTVWLIVSIVVTNEHHLGHKSLGLESLRVLRVVCLLAEGATLLLFAVFLATFVHEFSNVTLQHFMVSFINPSTHQVKVEKQCILP